MAGSGSPQQVDAAVLARRWAAAEAERAAMVHLARHKGLSEVDAEDCVQEAILRVVPRADLDEARMGGLLATVVMRRAIDLHRRARSTARVTQRLEGAAVTQVEAPEDALCDRAEAEWSAALVNSLPPLQRRVLFARAEGRSWNDIAAEMSTSVKAVESAVSRARAAIRHAIAATLGIATAVAHRWRSVTSGTTTTTMVSSSAAAVVLVVFTMPLLHHAPGAEEHGADGGRSDSRVVQFTTRQDAADGGARLPPTAAGRNGDGHGRGRGGGGDDDGDGGDGRKGAPSGDMRADIAAPPGNGVADRVWVTTEEQEEDHVTFITWCMQNYRVGVEPDGYGLPDVNADCEETADNH